MMFHLINSGTNTGTYNMEFDMFLVQQLQNNSILPSIRFYSWNPYTISLGYNQSDHFLNKERCSSENIDIVRRPTGGRAVYHSEELTYSVVQFINGKSIATIHNEISQALVSGLRLLGINATLSAISSSTEKIYFGEHSSACFSSISRSEVHVNGKKIVGSAQRRFGDVVLQHGSIMIGSEHKLFPKFYFEQNENHVQYLKETTTEIETELGKKISFDEVANAMQKGFEQQWKVAFSEFPKEREVQFTDRNLQLLNHTLQEHIA